MGLNDSVAEVLKNLKGSPLLKRVVIPFDEIVSHKENSVRNRVEQAFIDFKNGKRPDGYKAPRHWYVLDKVGVAYPAKAIYALATNDRPANFNTRDARLALAELEYSLINMAEILNSDDFDQRVNASRNIGSQQREARLENADKIPQVRYVLVKQYVRNPDVVAAVLERAAGHCEKCNAVAPFNRKIDNTPYLEVHHKIQLSKGGEDTVSNAIGLCPNCHRRMHCG